ncbi:TraR/DksA family transcriptional regulator [Marinobacterium sediminicola]|uniref:Transcriptional regulator, TraR/DksA family n=1 Tax=Marinobacterium sediminicola TaxID=518898 RepID=A0ABY1RX21_9GAMM|nr:TraR/DksA C4-type zinc finger protein [Marinobacterium sediminicola]ULG67899.1 TraR/DksA C4-type zinc finger protein [Marinobacterium sediminicola]SMR71395.1 transcriptional regulator, TraR/DksA family [Marinobacterium sediminicola]
MAAVLSRDELEHMADTLHELLEALHEELADELNEIEHVRHLLKRHAHGQGDRQATLEVARRLNLEHMRHHLESIASCNQALERINRGRFGRCRCCGEAIELNRLRADPLIDTCLSCQS